MHCSWGSNPALGHICLDWNMITLRQVGFHKQVWPHIAPREQYQISILKFESAVMFSYACAFLSGHHICLAVCRHLAATCDSCFLLFVRGCAMQWTRPALSGFYLLRLVQPNVSVGESMPWEMLSGEEVTLENSGSHPRLPFDTIRTFMGQTIRMVDFMQTNNGVVMKVSAVRTLCWPWCDSRVLCTSEAAHFE